MAQTAFAPFCPYTQKALAWPPRTAHGHGWQTQFSLVVNPVLCAWTVQAHLLHKVKAMTFSRCFKVFTEHQVSQGQIPRFAISAQLLSVTVVFLGCELPIISAENMCASDQSLVKVGVESGGITFSLGCNTSIAMMRFK